MDFLQDFRPTTFELSLKLYWSAQQQLFPTISTTTSYLNDSHSTQVWHNNHQPPHTVTPLSESGRRMTTAAAAASNADAEANHEELRTTTTRRRRRERCRRRLQQLNRLTTMATNGQKGWGDSRHGVGVPVRTLFSYFLSTFSHSYSTNGEEGLPPTHRLRALVTTSLREVILPFSSCHVFLYWTQRGEVILPSWRFFSHSTQQGEDDFPSCPVFSHSSQLTKRGGYPPFSCTGHNKGRSSSPLSTFCRTRHNKGRSSPPLAMFSRTQQGEVILPFPIIIICIKLLYHFDQFGPNWEILHFRKISKNRINPKKIKSGVKKKGVTRDTRIDRNGTVLLKTLYSRRQRHISPGKNFSTSYVF